MRTHFTCRAGLCAAVLALSANAQAHIALRTPTARLAGDATNNELKQGPCGQASNGRTDNVHEFAPGETITVTIDEFIPHPGYFRIAFDDDGDDSFPIRADMDSIDTANDDPEAVNPVDGTVILAYLLEGGSGGEHTAQVTLPNIECENCTLQVIQFMYNGVGNGRDDEYYYQCADLALRAGASGAGGATSTSSTSSTSSATTGGGATSMTADSTSSAMTTGLSATTGMVGMGGAASTTVGLTTTGTADVSSNTVGTTGSSVGGAGTVGATVATNGGLAGSGPIGSTMNPEQASDEGCSCRLVGAPGRGSLAFASLTLGLFFARRRRD